MPRRLAFLIIVRGRGQRELKKLGMLIVQDQIWGRVTQNRSQGKATWYFCDEFHLLLREEQTAAFSCEIWKRFRKWGGVPTGATQNVKDLLSSPEIENILENSDFISLSSGIRKKPGAYAPDFVRRLYFVLAGAGQSCCGGLRQG